MEIAYETRVLLFIACTQRNVKSDGKMERKRFCEQQTLLLVVLPRLFVNFTPQVRTRRLCRARV